LSGYHTDWNRVNHQNGHFLTFFEGVPMSCHKEMADIKLIIQTDIFYPLLPIISTKILAFSYEKNSLWGDYNSCEKKYL